MQNIIPFSKSYIIYARILRKENSTIGKLCLNYVPRDVPNREIFHILWKEITFWGYASKKIKHYLQLQPGISYSSVYLIFPEVISIILFVTDTAHMEDKLFKVLQ